MKMCNNKNLIPTRALSLEHCNVVMESTTAQMEVTKLDANVFFFNSFIVFIDYCSPVSKKCFIIKYGYFYLDK